MRGGTQVGSPARRGLLGLTHLEGIKTNEKQHFIPDVIAGNAALRSHFHSAPPPPPSSVPSRRTPPPPPLTKTQVEGRWAHSPLLAQLVHQCADTVFFGEVGGWEQTARGSLAVWERGGNWRRLLFYFLVRKGAGYSYSCRGTHCLPWHPIGCGASGKPELGNMAAAFRTSHWRRGGEEKQGLRALPRMWCHVESKPRRLRRCWRINY